VAKEHQVIEPHTRMNMLNTLAEVYLYAQDRSAAAERTAWSNKARRACRSAIKASAACRAKAPKAMRLQGTYEWLSGKPAAAQKCWQKGLAEAGRMGLRYDVAMILMEMGVRLKERAHLEQARATFAEIGIEVS